MRFSVLGPLSLGGQPAASCIPGRKERAVLAILLADPGALRYEDELIELLWRQPPPRTAARSLEAHVSRLRAALSKAVPEHARLERIGAAWRLDVSSDDLDSAVFARLAGVGSDAVQSQRYVEAVGLADRALGLWHGHPYDGYLDLRPCAEEARRLVSLRLRLEESRAQARLALGHAGQIVEELRLLVDAEPLREERWAMLMLALFRTGRQAEALQAYGEVRALLRQELGVDPSPALQRRHAEVLGHSANLRVSLVGAHGDVDAIDVAAEPYPGLAPYGSERTAVFFGRERAAAQVIARLGSYDVVTLVGVSGSGKSSLIDGGVLPALRSAALPGSQGWHVEHVHPPRASPERQGDVPPADLIICDQLEEIVVQTPLDVRSRFAAALAARRAGGARLVLAVRSDYWAVCAGVPGLAELLVTSTVMVGPLSEDELRRVVTEPARRLGVAVDEDVVDTVVGEVGGRDGALPLVSTALARAWAVHRGDELTLADYRAGGGVTDAVRRLAEEAFSDMGADEQALARRLLLRLAVDGPSGVVRRRIPVDDLVGTEEPARHVLIGLAVRRIVVVSDEGAEIVHESLFSQWPRLAGWLEEDAAARRLRSHLMPAAREWDRRGRRVDDLYSGARLAEAVSWLNTPGAALSDLERDFLRAGERQSEIRRVEASEQALRERRSARRLRGLLAAALVLLVVASMAGLLALQAKNRADRDRSLAQALQRSAEAERLGTQALLENQPGLSLQLAAQAVALDASPETTSNLLGALLRVPNALAIRHIQARVSGLAVTPDGSEVAVCTNRGLLELRDGRNLGATSLIWSGNGLPCGPPSFLAGGRLIALVQQVEPTGARLIIRRVADGRVVARRRLTDGYWTYASPSGRYLVTSGQLGSDLWTRHGPSFGRRSFGVDQASNIGDGGSMVALAPPRGEVVIRSIPSGSVVTTVPRSSGDSLLAFAQQRPMLAIGTVSGAIRLIDARSGKARATLVGSGPGIDQLFFADHDQLLVTATFKGAVTVWRVSDGQTVTSVTTGSSPLCAVSPDGRTLYTAADGTIVRWDLTGRRGFATRLRVPTGITAAAATADGSTVAVGTTTGYVDLLRPPALAVEARFWLGGAVGSVVAVPGRSKVVAATSSGVYEVDISPGEPGHDVVRRLSSSAATYAAEGNDGTLAVASLRRAVLTIRNGRLASVVRLPASPGQVAFDPRGRLLAVACDDSSVRIIDPRDGSVRQVIPGTHDPVPAAIAFAGDHTLLIGRRDGSLATWNLSTQQFQSPTAVAVNGIPTNVAVQGRMAAVGSSGTGVGLVDLPTGTRYGGGELPVGVEGTLPVIDTANRTLVALTGSGTAIRWPLSVHRWMSRACTLPGGGLSRRDWRAELPDAAYRPVC